MSKPGEPPSWQETQCIVSKHATAYALSSTGQPSVPEASARSSHAAEQRTSAQDPFCNGRDPLHAIMPYLRPSDSWLRSGPVCSYANRATVKGDSQQNSEWYRLTLQVLQLTVSHCAGSAELNGNNIFTFSCAHQLRGNIFRTCRAQKRAKLRAKDIAKTCQCGHVRITSPDAELPVITENDQVLSKFVHPTVTTVKHDKNRHKSARLAYSSYSEASMALSLSLLCPLLVSPHKAITPSTFLATSADEGQAQKNNATKTRFVLSALRYR